MIACMQILLVIALVLALLLGPNLWVQRIMRRYTMPENRYGDTGGALARQLLDELGLSTVRVEETQQGDHYDPRDRTVRLQQDNFQGRSLTALTIAAHEVGHAQQHAKAYAPLMIRTRLVQFSQMAQRFGAGMMMAAPMIGLLTRAPGVTGLVVVGGLLSLGSAVLVHLVTLPTEFDASFGRALPMLEKGDYLYRADYPHARRLLRAAAMTYVSASLMSILNIARWWAILRR